MDVAHRDAVLAKSRGGGLAQQDRAGALKPRPDDAVLFGDMVVERRVPEGGADPGGGRQVLDSDRQTVHRPELGDVAGGKVALCGAGLFKRLLGTERDERVDRWVDAFDAIQ